MTNLTDLTIKEAHEKLVSKEITVRELVDAYLSNIKEKDADINAYLEVYSDIDDQVQEAQKKIDAGQATILTGIPISVKDNLVIEDRVSGAASKMLEGYTGVYTATAIKKLQKHSPVLLGRVNMDEFAMGGSTENSAYQATKNPHDLNRVAGGSSGGSAASVTAQMALGSLGSDTGGSIRQPAAYCGCVGLKPTYGSVSRYGLMAMGSSLDVIGPLTKNVADSKIFFEAMRGNDPLDATSMSENAYENDLGKVKKIGVPKDILEHDSLDSEIRANIEKQIDVLKKEGYEIVDISLPNIEYAIAVYYIIMCAESSTNLSRYDGVKFGARVEGKDLQEMYFKTRGEKFGKEVKRRIMLGTYVLSSGYYDAYYNKATQVRGLIQKDFEKAFEEVDAIIMPTTPTPAFKIGENTDDPLKMYLEDIFTVPANLVGIPAISVPVGKNKEDLPLAMQFLAPRYHEQHLFELGTIIENGRGK